VIDAFNLLGQALVWDALVVVVAIALWLRGRRFEAVVLVVGVIGAEAGASAAKIIVGRTRPPGIAVADVITQASLPGGHATRAVVTPGLLTAMAWRRPRWRGPAPSHALAFIVLMGIARIAVGEHWADAATSPQAAGVRSDRSAACSEPAAQPSSCAV